jgi:hypothetical protein
MAVQRASTGTGGWDIVTINAAAVAGTLVRVGAVALCLAFWVALIVLLGWWVLIGMGIAAMLLIAWGVRGPRHAAPIAQSGTAPASNTETPADPSTQR